MWEERRTNGFFGTMNLQNIESTQKIPILQQDGAPRPFTVLMRQLVNQENPNCWRGRAGAIQ